MKKMSKPIIIEGHEFELEDGKATLCALLYILNNLSDTSGMLAQDLEESFGAMLHAGQRDDVDADLREMIGATTTLILALKLTVGKQFSILQDQVEALLDDKRFTALVEDGIVDEFAQCVQEYIQSQHEKTLDEDDEIIYH